MAQGTPNEFETFIIEVGNGATPTEVFTKICAVRTKKFEITNNTNKIGMPDCADESKAPFNISRYVSQEMTLSGTAYFVAENRKLLLEWARNQETKNARVYPGSAATGEIEYFQAPTLLTQLSLGGEFGDVMSADVSFEFAADPTDAIAA